LAENDSDIKVVFQWAKRFTLNREKRLGEHIPLFYTRGERIHKNNF